MSNTCIENIANLIFFTEKGYELPTLKTYVIEWEICPHSLIADNFISNPKGHFIFNIEDETRTIQTVVDEKGKIINCETTVQGSFDTFTATYNTKTVKDSLLILFNWENTYYKSKGHYRSRITGKTESLGDELLTEKLYNTVKITINTLDNSITDEFPINQIFSAVTCTSSTLSQNSNSADNISYMLVLSLTLETLEPNEYNYATAINALIDKTVGYDNVFPCVRYICSFTQDKVSTDFVAASTMIIYEEDGSIYSRPSLENSNYSLRFEFLKDSEMKFISSNSVADIIWDDYYEVDTDTTTNAFEEGIIDRDTPIYFSVGFTAPLEGCYQNIMVMYIKDNDTDKKYILGLVTFLTEVEGEDERYRALLGNFGIPDPKKYPNIFSSQDPDEQGVDWTLINIKSKELMLEYDNIFPYVGTYKALLGAIKFLGYQDLIFKEWYKIKDQNGKDKLVTVLTYDLQTGETIQTKLKRLGVSYGDFERYKKLNRLTMIYHLNEIDEDTGETITAYSSENPYGTDVYYQIPTTYKVYEYRTDEILAKLYSVKQWLERYILGVNCYISDICGEGIVIERLKTQGYVTLHHMKDFTTVGSFTPKITKHSEFINSSCVMTCSLNEFDSLTFEDYEDYNIEAFILDTSIPANFVEPIYISAPLETLVVANEFLFLLNNNDKETGSLAEFTDTDFINNPILLDENEILFYDDTLNISKIEQKELPIIEITQGNLRKCNGNWKSNIAYSISSIIDDNTGEQYYMLCDEDTGDVLYRGLQKLCLHPYITKSALNKPVYHSELVYTTLNKWNVPMFIIRDYKIGNNSVAISGDYILEITMGRMIFRNKISEINTGKAMGCELVFDTDEELLSEQPIKLNYSYLSDRLPIYKIDKEKLSKYTVANTSLSDASISECVMTNKTIDMYVNRLGSYTVSVTAYDNYNLIYTNISDDLTNVTANPIGIDAVINSKYVYNSSDFYPYNSSGILLSNDENVLLYNDLNKSGNYPIYPLNYRIYDIDPVLEDPNRLEYDNLSYAIDTPKTGDFIIFNNFTERVLNIEKADTSLYKLKLLDENPNNDTIRNSEYVGLCIYDNIKKDIYTDIYPLKVKKLHFEDSNDKYDENNSYMTVLQTDDTSTDVLDILDILCERCIDSSLLDSSSFFINSINAYVYSANEYLIDNVDSSIIVDYDNKQTKIYDNVLHFVESQVVKICYATERVIHNSYTPNAIDNETAYRITDVSVADGSCYYILDGIVDLYKLNNKLYHNQAIHISNASSGPLDTSTPYKIKMCPAHLRAAQYILRVNDSNEYMTSIYNGGTVIKTTVEYEPTPLLFNDYLDTTYSAFVCDYDPKLLLNIWQDPVTLFSTGDLYRYRNFPITISKGRSLILTPILDLTTLTTKFNDTSVPLRVHWDWKSYLIDDHSNWHTGNDNIDKQVVFRSANKILSIKPELLGTLSPNMECIDVYGNKIVNEYDGYVYVDGTGPDVVTPADTSTRDIYYKDVYIVGFESQFEPVSVLSNAGLAKTYSLFESGLVAAGEPVNDDKEIVNYNYKIYYNDGTVVENEGATFTLINNSGNLSKNNKVKKVFGEATELHKSVTDLLNGVITIDNPTEFDMVSDQDFSLDILLYGTSVTTDIYNLSFTVENIPSNGIDKLDNDILTDYITNIKYTLRRSAGEIETMESDTLSSAMLKIKDFKFSHNTYGNIDYIPSNDKGLIQIGLLQLTVLFVVNGIMNEITTSGLSYVNQL